MTDWQTKKLGELTIKIGSGITPRGGADIFTDKGVLFIRSQNIKNGIVDVSDKKYIPRDIDQQMPSSRVKKSDVLYNITGASIGRSAIYQLDEPANVNQHVCIVRLKKDNPKFINYTLSSDVGKRNLWSFQAGGNREGLNFQQLASFKIPIPKINEQERIVGVLEIWDEYIEKLEQKIELKKQLKKGLMQLLLTGRHRLPGFTNEWQNVRYSDLCKFQSGFAFSSANFSNITGVRLIRNRDLKSNETKLFYRGTPPSEHLVNNGDILIGMDGDFIACRWTEGEALLNQRVGRLTNFVNADPNFVFYRSQRDLKQIENETTSTTVKHLSAKEFEKRRILTPSIEEQKAIAKILLSCDRNIDLLKQKRHTLLNQKKYLLKNLITGTIRTPENLKPYEVQS